MELESRSPDEVPADTGEVKPRRSGGKRRIAVFLTVSLACVALLALLGSQLLVPAQGQTNSGTSPLVGHPAPDFTLAALSSGPAPALHLARLKGKPVVLNFWASWCDPCQQEAPLLQATWQRVRSQGVVFVGIDFQDDHRNGLNFLRTYGITYPNVVDDTGSTAINYGVTGVPETFFLNRSGVIVSHAIGELTEQSMQSPFSARRSATRVARTGNPAWYNAV
jgi:cytochrome c biogenesis protein CcmG/thiol:disulfide interchange protein DsbE